MENTIERLAQCRYKAKIDKRNGFWQNDLTAAVHELLAFITPKGCVFKWKVMPFWGRQRFGPLPTTDEQNDVYTEAQASCTRVDFSRG